MKPKTYKKLMKFRDDRDWAQFHSGENLAKSIAIEAGELLEIYQYGNMVRPFDCVKEELADIFMYATFLADAYELNVDKIVLQKLKQNEKKYPVNKVKGSYKKYTEYQKKK